MNPSQPLIEKIETLQGILMARATGGGAHDDGITYRRLRDELMAKPIVSSLPAFVRTCRDLDSFWSFIKPKLAKYDERRQFIREAFEPCLSNLEAQGASTVNPAISVALEKLDSDHVRREWAKALSRSVDDPDGALTSARTLLETVCKHILDKSKIPYEDRDDLPKLYRETAKLMNLAPDQHAEEPFKRILGGCTSVVEGLGTLRNRMGDAHGKALTATRPAPRHAELGVSLAGAMATFLVKTWEERKAQNNEVKR